MSFISPDKKKSDILGFTAVQRAQAPIPLDELKMETSSMVTCETKPCFASGEITSIGTRPRGPGCPFRAQGGGRTIHRLHPRSYDRVSDQAGDDWMC